MTNVEIQEKPIDIHISTEALLVAMRPLDSGYLLPYYEIAFRVGERYDTPLQHYWTKIQFTNGDRYNVQKNYHPNVIEDKNLLTAYLRDFKEKHPQTASLTDIKKANKEFVTYQQKVKEWNKKFIRSVSLVLVTRNFESIAVLAEDCGYLGKDGKISRVVRALDDDKFYEIGTNCDFVDRKDHRWNLVRSCYRNSDKMFRTYAKEINKKFVNHQLHQLDMQIKQKQEDLEFFEDFMR